jgi:hypothetical protein
MFGNPRPYDHFDDKMARYDYELELCETTLLLQELIDEREHATDRSKAEAEAMRKAIKAERARQESMHEGLGASDAQHPHTPEQNSNGANANITGMDHWEGDNA